MEIIRRKLEWAMVMEDTAAVDTAVTVMDTVVSY